MKKVLVNRCPNGFTLSNAQRRLFPELEENPKMRDSDVNRADRRLIESFENGDRRGDGRSTLTIVEIPEEADFVIVERDGHEDVVYTTQGRLERA